MFDASQWRKYFEKAQAASVVEGVEKAIPEENVVGVVSLMRQIVMEGTLDACDDGFAMVSEGHNLHLFGEDLLTSDTKMVTLYSSRSRVAEDNPEWTERTVVHVLAADPVDFCIWSADHGKAQRPLLILDASNALAGGDVLHGGEGLEAELFRRSNAWHLVEDPDALDTGRTFKYPLNEGDMECVYIPNCTVFRHSEANGYAFRDNAATISVLLLPMAPEPKFSYNTEYQTVDFDPSVDSRLRKALHVALGAAKLQDHDQIVFAPLGINNLRRYHAVAIANVIMDVLVKQFMYAFQTIVLASPPEHNDAKSVWAPYPITDTFRKLWLRNQKPRKIVHLPCSIV